MSQFTTAAGIDVRDSECIGANDCDSGSIDRLNVGRFAKLHHCGQILGNEISELLPRHRLR
jgi:hypothetical protein